MPTATEKLETYKDELGKLEKAAGEYKTLLDMATAELADRIRRATPPDLDPPSPGKDEADARLAAAESLSAKLEEAKAHVEEIATAATKAVPAAEKRISKNKEAKIA